MRLLVTGSGRSGTHWVAAALRTCGLDAGHERAFHGRYADVDGDWTVEVSAAAAPHTPMPDTYVVQLVRQPLQVIASLVHRPPWPNPATRLPARYLPEFADAADDLVRQAVIYWIGWNNLVVADHTIRLEDITADTITNLARIVDVHAQPAELPAEPLNAAMSRPPPITWAALAHYREVEVLRATAAAHGYPTHDHDMDDLAP